MNMCLSYVGIFFVVLFKISQKSQVNMIFLGLLVVILDLNLSLKFVINMI